MRLLASAVVLAVVSCPVVARASTTPGPLPPLPSPLPSLPALCPTPAINPVSADPATSGVQSVAAAGAPAPQGPQAGPAGTWLSINGSNLVAPGCWTFIYLGGVQQAPPAPTAAGAAPPQPTATNITFAAGGTPAAPLSGAVSVVLSPGGPPTGGVASPGAVPPPNPATPGAVASNANLTFVEPPSIPISQALQTTEGAAVIFNGVGFRLGGLVSASPPPEVSYQVSASPTAPECDRVATDAVGSDTSLQGYAPTTYCAAAMVLHLFAPRDTADPAAGYSQVSTPAGSMEILPVVFGITPARAAPGEVVTVQGSGFGRGGSATVGGAVATVAAWSDRAVTLVVPHGAAGGTVTLVRGEDGRSIAAGGFTLVAAPPSSGGGGRPTSDTPAGSGVVEPLPGRWLDAVQAVAAIAAPPTSPPPSAVPLPTPRLQPSQVVPPAIAAIPPPGAGGLHPPLLGTAGLLITGVALALLAWRRRSLLATAEGVAFPAEARSGPAWARHIRPALWKAVSVVAGTLLIAVYVIAAFSTMTALAVALGFGASAPSPEGPVYLAAGAFVSVALTAIAIRYAYYYRCWAQTRHWFRTPEPVDVEALRTRGLPYIKVQVTTKGGALSVIERSLDELRDILERQQWLQPLLSAEVVTEVEAEAQALQERYQDSALAVTGITLPPDYQTPNGTRLKARALHHMCELRRHQGFNRKPGRTFVVHFDEETLVDEANLLVLVDYLSRDPRPISQGPIVYPLEWRRTPWICRALESTRPFGCSECARVMEHPPPPHLHGSNLVVDEQVENRLGWDFGTVDGQPYVAEDLLFGLRAYAALGEGAFGWHGATMLEQPPFSLYWAVQQRLRWVLGALQGLRAMATDDEYADIPRRQKRRLQLAISFRVATYALGFPVGFAGLYFVLHPTQVATQWRSAFGLWHVLIIISGVSWFLSYQIGMARNLRYQDLGRRQRVVHAVVMVLMTPIAGFCETVGPFLAVVRWMFGLRRASWTPTPKQGQPRLRPGVN